MWSSPLSDQQNSRVFYSIENFFDTTGEEVVAESAEAEAGPDSSVKENLEPLPRIIGFLKACWAKFDALMEKCIYTPFLGAPFDEGVWIAPQGPRSMFFNRFGAMFEDYRHHPTVIK